MRQHAGTVHAEQGARNSAMMAALVALHNSLSAAASAAQQEAGMVITKEAAGAMRSRSDSASGSGEDKRVVKKREAGASAAHPAPRARTVASQRATHVAAPMGALQYSPMPSYQLPQHQLGPPAAHAHLSPAQYSYPNPYTYMPASMNGASSHLYGQPTPTSPQRRSGPRPAPIKTSAKYYPASLGYSAPHVAPPSPQPTVSPNSPSRVTLPPISQLLPSPFARTPGTAGAEEPMYYALNGERTGDGSFAQQYEQPAYQSVPPPAGYYAAHGGYGEQVQYPGALRNEEQHVAPYPVRSGSVSSVASSHGSLSNSSSFSGEADSAATYAYSLAPPAAYPGYHNVKPTFPLPIPSYALPVGQMGMYEEGNPRVFTPNVARESSERSTTLGPRYAPYDASLSLPSPHYGPYSPHLAPVQRPDQEPVWGYGFDPTLRTGHMGMPMGLSRIEEGAQPRQAKRPREDRVDQDREGQRFGTNPSLAARV